MGPNANGPAYHPHYNGHNPNMYHRPSMNSYGPGMGGMPPGMSATPMPAGGGPMKSQMQQRNMRATPYYMKQRYPAQVRPR